MIRRIVVEMSDNDGNEVGTSTQYVDASDLNLDEAIKAADDFLDAVESGLEPEWSEHITESVAMFRTARDHGDRFNLTCTSNDVTGGR